MVHKGLKIPPATDDLGDLRAVAPACRPVHQPVTELPGYASAKLWTLDVSLDVKSIASHMIPEPSLQG